MTMTMMTTTLTMRKKRAPSSVRSVARLVDTPLYSIKRAKGVMALDLDLYSGLEKIRIRAWTRHRALRVLHDPAYIQERPAVVPAARRVSPVPTRTGMQ